MSLQKNITHLFDEKGISPVVSTILVVAIVITLAVIIFATLGGLQTQDTPQAGVTFDESNGQLTVTWIDNRNAEQLYVYKNGEPIDGAVLNSVGESITVSVASGDDISVVGELENGERSVIQTYTATTGSAVEPVDLSAITVSQQSQSTGSGYFFGSVILDDGDRVIINKRQADAVAELDTTTDTETSVIDYSSYSNEFSYLRYNPSQTTTFYLESVDTSNTPYNHTIFGFDSSSYSNQYDFVEQQVASSSPVYPDTDTFPDRHPTERDIGSAVPNGNGADVIEEDGTYKVRGKHIDVDSGSITVEMKQEVPNYWDDTGSRPRTLAYSSQSNAVIYTVQNEFEGEQQLVSITDTGETNILRNKTSGSHKEFRGDAVGEYFISYDNTSKSSIQVHNANTGELVTEYTSHSPANDRGFIESFGTNDNKGYIVIDGVVYAVNMNTGELRELEDFSDDIVSNPVPDIVKISINPSSGHIGVVTGNSEYTVYSIDTGE